MKKSNQKTWLIFLIIPIIFALTIALIIFYSSSKNKTILSNNNSNNNQILDESPLPQPDFWLKISKIDVVAPIVENVDGNSKSAYNEALEKGVAHYQGTSLPGQASNIFIFGHSSSSVGRGAYARVFERLNELEKNDEINVFYKDKEYNYLVKDKKIVEPNETKVLDPTESEQLTLMTCWPINTSDKRLIVISKPKT